MTPAEGAGAMARRLLAEIRADRSSVVRRSDEVRIYSEADATLSSERSAALALALDRTYTALESILDRIARSLEGGLPPGEDWHHRLLANARLDIAGVRPSILGPTAATAASELRCFRHFLRHAYAADLDPQRLGTLARSWSAAYPDLMSDLDNFERFLDQLARRLDTGAR